MSNLVITVRGGIVQHVASDNPDDRILIMDYDNVENDPEAFENWEPTWYEPDQVVEDIDNWVSEQVFP